MTVFTSAYVAEIVRAGIQSVPRGQAEAARAVGLSAVQTMRHIILPQAIRNMIPALVGQFISLFKDTSLAVIIGLTELVGTGRALLAITAYLHDVREVYIFLILIYFVFAYSMSYASRRLESRLGLGER
jgi:general L-amino acid transport system permease protein